MKNVQPTKTIQHMKSIQPIRSTKHIKTAYEEHHSTSEKH